MACASQAIFGLVLIPNRTPVSDCRKLPKSRPRTAVDPGGAGKQLPDRRSRGSGQASKYGNLHGSLPTRVWSLSGCHSAYGNRTTPACAYLDTQSYMNSIILILSQQISVLQGYALATFASARSEIELCSAS